MARRKVAPPAEPDWLTDEEVSRPPSAETKARARRELVELCALHAPECVPAARLLLARAEAELHAEGPQLALAIPPNPKRKAEQLAFPFPSKFSPSPAGEGELGSSGSGGRRPRVVREPSPRGRRAPQGTRMGAGGVLVDELGKAYALVLTRRRSQQRA